MQAVTETYTSILSGEHWTECQLLVEDENGTMQTVDETKLFAITVREGVLEDGLSIGNAVSAEIDVSMVYPVEWSVKKMAKLIPQVRLRNNTQESEWLSKGVFYVDTRDHTKYDAFEDRLNLHGYDAMLMTEQDYPAVAWNTKSDWSVLIEICSYLGWQMDGDTVTFFNTTRAGYVLPTPYGYSIREVLQSIAAANVGNFVMDEEGKLRLVRFTAIPAETFYLLTPQGDNITMGGNRIVLQ